MRHTKKDGIAYSVFPFGHSRQMFLVGEPDEHYSCEDGPDYPRQIRALLENVTAVCEKEGFVDNAAGMCHVFIKDIGKRELVWQLADELCRQKDEALCSFFGAVTFVPQAPASGAAVSIEIWAMSGEKPHFKVEDEKHRPRQGQRVVAEFDDMKWFFGGGCQPDQTAPSLIGAYNRSKSAFDMLEMLLREPDFPFDQLLRTWIYQGHLVLDEGNTQRYKELNRARTDAFGDTQFLKDYLPKDYKGVVYPASTGIGADDFDIVMSAVALDTKRKDVIAVPLENPNQTSAFDYGAVYSPQSPKFSRAMAVAMDDTCLIFVSGTASITDSESRYPEDPVKQTEQTLDNIAALIDDENLSRHGIPDIACKLDNLVCVRVYVKRRSEFEVIRQVCERRLPKVPILYTVADVCRPELLVEIEGVAVACKPPRI